ncbi:MAG: Na+/H+ antiporter NhaC family protein [Oligoflexales bacterium]
MTATHFPDWLAILPPLVTITAALATRHAIGALFLGLLTGSFLAVDGQLLAMIPHLYKSLLSVLYESSHGLDIDHISLFGFLWFLGILIHLLITSGGMEQLSLQFMRHKTSKIKTQLTIICLGLAVFIDDYFNTLAVGTVSRPLADRSKISREKLAYFLDSTAGPVCILAPISSWGATIIAILDGIARNENLSTDGLSLFLESIFLNFYSLFTIGAVFYVAITDFNFKAMAKSEKELNVTIAHTEYSENTTTYHTPLWAMGTLLAATLGGMFLSAYFKIPATATAMDFVRYMEIGPSLWFGALSALTITVVKLPRRQGTLLPAAVIGFKTMAPAMTILFLAWGLASVIGELKTGEFIVEQLTQANVPISRLPLVSFLLAGLLSFTTGTSWATFSILLPIIAQMNGSSPEALSLCIAAVLGGSVFGDHCSPISDTSILSSTGAGCDHMNHVVTQLPYCITTAIMSISTYLLIDFVQLSPLVSFTLITTTSLAILHIFRRQTSASPTT